MLFLRFIASLASVLFFSGTCLAAEPAVPWPNGEKLTYEIHWSTLPAAQGSFHALDRGDHWEFQVELRSRGMVETAYPISDWFWSIQQKNPWRSLEYGEDRSEGKKRIKERTQVDYKTHQAIRERWTEGKEDKIVISASALDDIGSMLYSLRCGSWAPHDKRTINVYESSSVKSGEVECVDVEERAIGVWPAQKLIKLRAEPFGDERKKGGMLVWLTDDARRLPLRAYLIFKYGAFTIDLAGNEVIAK
jgi:Protein of unknown function (DUF3108)